MRRWQYKVVVQRAIVRPETMDSADHSVNAEILDLYGREDWELVSVVLQNDRRDSDPLVFYSHTYYR
jgi:hypothetical protein